MSDGVYTAAVRFPAGQNLSRCVTCDETSGELEAPNGIETPTISSPNGTVKVNGDLESNKECSASQCNSKPDSPSSSPAILIIRRICFGCSSDDDGGDNDDGSSDGPDGGFIPFVPFFPFLPFVPFFPPFVPFFPIAGAMSGGPGVVPVSGLPGAPPSPVPFVTILVNATAPVTLGGLYIPYVNFTEDIVYCGVETRGLTVIDESSLPHTLYICEATLNGTYAWVPYCGCSGYSSNYGQTFQNTSHVYTQGSTLFISNSSQLWVEGNTYLGGDSYARNLTITQQLSVCNSTAKMNSIESCTGGPVDFLKGLTVNGTTINPNGTVDVCSSGQTARFNQISSCSGGAPLFSNGIQFTQTPPPSPASPPLCEWTCGGPNASTAQATLSRARIVNLPSASVEGYVTTCDGAAPTERYLETGELRSCDGVTPIYFPQGVNATAISASNATIGTQTITDTQVVTGVQTVVTQVVSGTQTVVTQVVTGTSNVTGTQTVASQTVTTQVVNNQNVLNQTVTTQTVQDITVVNTPVFGGTAFYYTAAASYSGDLNFCISWDTNTPTYVGCTSPSTPSAATVNVQLQRVGNMVYGTMNRTDATTGQLLFSSGTANSCTLFAPVGVVVGADFRPRTGTIAAGPEAQPFLLENQGTDNVGCFCSLVPYVTDQGLLFFRPRQLTASLAHQCCTLSNTAGTFKSSTAFAIAARGTYSGLLPSNTFTPGLDDLYTFSYVLPL